MNTARTNDSRPGCYQRGTRTAFTLVELLVAIAIIIVLMGILLVTLGGVLSNAREAATRTTIKKSIEIVQQIKQQLNTTFESERPNIGSGVDTLYKLPDVTATAIAQNDKATAFILKKYMYKQALPQRFEDLLGVDGVPGILQRGSFDPSLTNDLDLIATDTDTNFESAFGDPRRPDVGEFRLPRHGVRSDDSPIARIFAKRLEDLGPAGAANFAAKHQPQTESAELMYLLFTEGTSFGLSDAGSADFSQREAQDTDGDGFMELVDGWGNPLRFYRWPTRLVAPSSGNMINTNLNPYWDILSSVKFQDLPSRNDPEDPSNSLWPFFKSNGAALFEEGAANTGLQFVLHTPGVYHNFLIVSAGPDGVLGLEEPWNYSQLGHLANPLLSIRDAVDTATSDDAKLDVIYNSVLADDISNLQLGLK